MGLSSLPAPSEGVLTLLLVNTALSISLFKEVVRTILHALHLDRYYPADGDDDDVGPDPGGYRPPPSSSPPLRAETFTDRFRDRSRPAPFRCLETRAADCRVCLARFEPDSVVNRLPCGHLFHNSCLEKWLDYHHVTCPLCRTRVLPAEAEAAASWHGF